MGIRTQELNGSWCDVCEEDLRELPQGFTVRNSENNECTEPLISIKEELAEPIIVGNSDIDKFGKYVSSFAVQKKGRGGERVSRNLIFNLKSFLTAVQRRK